MPSARFLFPASAPAGRNGLPGIPINDDIVHGLLLVLFGCLFEELQKPAPSFG